MSYYPDRQRPGIMTFLGVISLIWSALTLGGVVVGAGILILVGAGSWFAGPVAGAIGTAIVAVICLWLTVSSFLSILLFQAGWKTLKGDPRGIHLHRLWAWVSLALDAVGILLSGGTAPNSWTGIIYAIIVLYVTTLPEVLNYYGLDPYRKPLPNRGWSDELA